jgi:two-component system, NarL family, invasion response regulator UvrY
MIRVLVIDDHPVVRQGILQIIQERFPGAITGEASDGVQGLQRIREHTWEVVVLDLTLPGPNGLTVMKTALTEQPGLRIVVMSIHSAKQFARRVLAAGAAAYLTKGSAAHELVHAIRTVHSGNRYVSNLKDLEGPTGTPHDALSDREYQVLRMLGSGLSPTQIARTLSLSIKTVSTYRARVLSKLDLHSTAELMRYAIEYGLVDRDRRE